jgi:hypothetical protein
MSNTYFPGWRVSDINAELFPVASLAVNIGDLLYWDAANHVPRPFSALADQLSAAAQQAALAPLFLGVANSARLASDALVATALRILTDGIWEFACDSATFEPGDYVGASYNTNIARDQQVAKVGTASLAIGRAVKRYSAATTKVKVRLMSRLLLGFEGTLGASAEAPGANTVAAGSIFSDAGALPAGTSSVYPTTGADDTKGVRISVADQVTGRRLTIINTVANKILNVYGPSGAVINAAAANAAFASVSGHGVTIVCLSGSGNTWLAT